MSKRVQTKWICDIKSPDGKLETVIMKFKPYIGYTLPNGSKVVKR